MKKANLSSLFPKKYLSIPITLWLIIALGVVLRITYLFHHDLWFDEAISLLISQLSIPELINTARFDNNPPLYYLFLHFWGKISQHIIWLRTLSLVFSTATIPITFLLAKSLANLRTATLAALLMAIMPVAMDYFQKWAHFLILLPIKFSFFLCLQPFAT